MPARVEYAEGQWFGVTLREGGFALGIVARGDSQDRCGKLGYFFAPRRVSMPDDAATLDASPSEAVLVGWFGDLYLLSGKWPLVPSRRTFHRKDWPVPVFGQIDHASQGTRGWRAEYRQDLNGWELPVRRIYVTFQEIMNLPKDGTHGAGSVEILLGRLLRPQSFPA
jgi:hypothetical protein